MDLLDSDSKIMEESQKKKASRSKTGRKAGFAGLNRFKGLTDAYRAKEENNDSNTFKTDTDKSINKISDPSAPEKAKHEKPDSSSSIPPKIIKDLSKKQEEPLISSKSSIESKAVQTAQKLVDKIESETSLIEKKPFLKPKTINHSQEPAETTSEHKKYEATFNKNFKNSPPIIEITSDNNRDNIKLTTDNIQITPDNNTVNNTDNNFDLDNKHKNLSQDNTYLDPPNLKVSGLYDYKTLMGNEKNLLGIIFHECLREGSLETARIPMAVLSTKLNVSLGTAKMTVHRLKKKGLIESIEARRCKGGWSRYRISKDLYQDLQNDSIFFSSDSSRITKQLTKRVTNAPSSSSETFKIKNTTTNNLSEEWLVIQIPDNLREIGFVFAHIKQVASDGILTPDDVQNSLDAFSYDLFHNKVRATAGPLRFFMGVLRKQKVPYSSEEFLKQEKAQMESYMTKIKELNEAAAKMKEIEEYKKFESWESKLSQEEKDKFVPKNNFVQPGSHAEKALLKNYWDENIRDD